jgi:hypothetical protein
MPRYWRDLETASETLILGTCLARAPEIRSLGTRRWRLVMGDTFREIGRLDRLLLGREVMGLGKVFLPCLN